MVKRDSRRLSRYCPHCGIPMRYAPETIALRCPHCDHAEAIPPTLRTLRKYPYEAVAAAALAGTGPVRWLDCRECGTYVVDGGRPQCPTCTAPLGPVAAEGGLGYEAVLPFAFGRDGAEERLRAWMGSRRFAPSSLKNTAAPDTMRGIYLPHWTFDADTVTHYHGERGDDEYHTETVSEYVDGREETHTHQVVTTEWTPVTGTVALAIHDVLVPADGTVPTMTLNHVKPWPLDELLPFHPAYLEGYETPPHPCTAAEGLRRARAEMSDRIADACRDHIGGDHQQLHHWESHYRDITCRLVLLPVWLGTYEFRGRTWHVAINGRTGRTTGERPYSPLKIAALVVAITTLLALLYLWYRS